MALQTDNRLPFQFSLESSPNNVKVFTRHYTSHTGFSLSGVRATGNPNTATRF